MVDVSHRWTALYSRIDSDLVSITTWLAKRLNNFNLGYLDVI